MESCDYFIGDYIFRVTYLPGDYCHIGHIIEGQYTHRGISLCKRGEVFDIMLSMFYFINQAEQDESIDRCLHIGACTCFRGMKCGLNQYLFRDISNTHQQRNVVEHLVDSC